MIAVLGQLAELLREHGLDLLLGTSCVLAGVAVMVAFSRSLAARHRLLGTGVVAVAAYTLVALVPMPRWMGGDAGGGGEEVARAAAGDAEAAAEVDAAPGAGPVAPGILPAPWPGQTAGPGADAAAGVVASPRGIAARIPGRSAGIGAAPERRPVPSTELAGNGAAIDWADWLASALLAGGALFAAQLVLASLGLWRVLRASRPAPESLRRLAELPEHVRLLVTERHVQPFCCGVLRPTIVLPQRMAQPTAATRFVLLHEQQHLRSGDARLRAVLAVLRPLLFWQPLFWWLQHQQRFTGELLADDAAGRGAVADYVRCMMTLASQPTPSATGTLVATVFHRRSELFRRLEMMLKREAVVSPSPSTWQRRLRSAAAIALVTLTAGRFGVEPALAQNPGAGTVVQPAAEVGRAGSGQSPSKSSGSAASARELATQVAELRATIRALQAELTALDPERAGDMPASVADAPTIGVGHGAGGAPNRASGLGRAPGHGAAEAGGPPGAGGGAGASSAFDHSPTRDGVETHVVRPGDSYQRIARQYYQGVDGVNKLRRLNPDVDANRLRVGQRLVIDAPADRRPANRAAAPSGRARDGVGDRGLADLAGLVTRCIELRGEVEIEEVEVSYAAAAAKKGLVDERRVRIAEIRLRTKRSQHQALQRMLKAELQQAAEDLARTRLLAEKGFVTDREVHGTERRLLLLESALR